MPNPGGAAFIAHRRESDGNEQSLMEHLVGVSFIARRNASKIGLTAAGELIGLLHDLGKYSLQFRNYLLSAEGLIEPDADQYVDAKSLKGKIDHSTAGAQYLWNRLSNKGELGVFAGQLLSLCIASHHSGLINCISAEPGTFGEDVFTQRMQKPAEKTHVDEVVKSADAQVMARVAELLDAEELLTSFRQLADNIIRSNRSSPEAGLPQQLGLMVRFLFSCLIDADRTDTADFETPKRRELQQDGGYPNWHTLVDRLETELERFTSSSLIDTLRQQVSAQCRRAASRPRGVYTLTVPTGGGKTLASLRFALHHALHHGLDRIVYVIPFTTIIDQNAQVVRRILEQSATDRGRVVLEHHSNLTQEHQSWRDKILCENWDAPVVFTTMVQFLDSLFAAGTRGARRMHQLANALLIFDEIQTLPVRCVHLFNNAINFLVEQAHSSAVLCTATQPLLDAVSREKGAIRLSLEHEIVADKKKLFDELKRVEVRDRRRAGGWTYGQIAQLAGEEVERRGSCLVVVNTKQAARKIYELGAETNPQNRFHLSTGMCPSHRRKHLQQVCDGLKAGLPIMCVSTQLIEAGVDVDFRSVVRCLAGIDSIAQAAGRCNRNGRAEPCPVHIVNAAEERLTDLPEIARASEIAQRVLDDFRANPEHYGNNLFGPKAMEDYYRYYFFDRRNQMTYLLEGHPNGVQHKDSLLNLLSRNTLAVAEYQRKYGENPRTHFLQAFMTAGNAFEVIDAPTRGILVPYGMEGECLINELCSSHRVEEQYELLRRAQQFTINVFPQVLSKLANAGAVHPVQSNASILYLERQYYTEEFGLILEARTPMEILDV